MKVYSDVLPGLTGYRRLIISRVILVLRKAKASSEPKGFIAFRTEQSPV